MVLITGSVGPQPLDAITEADLNRRLREIDPLLSLKWFPNASWNVKEQSHEGRYALIVKWPEIDPRWELYRSGDIGEPLDILGWATIGELTGDDEYQMGGADDAAIDPSAIWNFVIKRLGEGDLSKGPSWKVRMKANAESNWELRNKRLKEAQEEMMEGFVDYRRQVHDIPFLGVGIDLTQEESERGE